MVHSSKYSSEAIDQEFDVAKTKTLESKRGMPRDMDRLLRRRVVVFAWRLWRPARLRPRAIETLRGLLGLQTHVHPPVRADNAMCLHGGIHGPQLCPQQTHS